MKKTRDEKSRDTVPLSVYVVQSILVLTFFLLVGTCGPYRFYACITVSNWVQLLLCFNVFVQYSFISDPNP